MNGVHLEMSKFMVSRVGLGLSIIFLFALSGCGGGRSAGSEERVYSHTVKPGESISDIADDYYGDPDRADALMTYNEVSEELLEPGTVIRIPMGDEDIAQLKVRERARAPYNRGLSLAENGSYLDAIQQFQTSLSVDPAFVDARYNLGVTFQKMKSYEKAREEFRRVVRERPKKAEYHFALGNSNFYLEEYRDASNAFEDVMELDHMHAKAQYSLAVCYEKMGDVDEAKAAWQRYLEIDAHSVWATEARKRLSELE